MSLVTALPCRDGIIVASDSASVVGNSSEPEYGAAKLYLAGGWLLSVTGGVVIRNREGRRVFSLPHVIACASPSRLELRDIPDIAKIAGEAMKRQLATTETPAGREAGASVIFWLPTTIATFTITHFGASPVSEHMVLPEARCNYVLQGLLQALPDQLSPSSVALMRRRPLVRDVTLEEAVAFVTDVQEAAAKALPSAIGGGVDVRLVGLDGVTVVEPHGSAASN